MLKKGFIQESLRRQEKGPDSEEGPHFTSPNRLLLFVSYLADYLHDQHRAGKKVLLPQDYLSASLRCLWYLQSSHGQVFFFFFSFCSLFLTPFPAIAMSLLYSADSYARSQISQKPLAFMITSTRPPAVSLSVPLMLFLHSSLKRLPRASSLQLSSNRLTARLHRRCLPLRAMRWASSTTILW